MFLALALSDMKLDKTFSECQPH